MKLRRILLGILLSGLAIYGLVWGFTSHFSNLSEGELVFQDEQSYTIFKSELFSHIEDVVQWDVSALASSPPIIVKFSIETQMDYIFPYGEKSELNFLLSRDTTKWGLPWILIIVGLLSVGVLLIINNIRGDLNGQPIDTKAK